MEDDFIFWKHPTLPGIKVEEIMADETDLNKKLWMEMARQIICEHGKDAFREIMHFHSGAPVLKGYDGRISITHTEYFFAMAFLPRTPECDLARFSLRAAMGIDAESLEREKVLKVREKFLNDEELRMIPEDNLQANIIAWTSKEALIKVSLNSAIDYRNDIVLTKLPILCSGPMVKADPSEVCGNAMLTMEVEGERKSFEMALFSYESERHCVTLAYSPKCARFKGS